MKPKLIALLFPLLFLFCKSHGQYKDLEGVFFGKVISFGAGGSVLLFNEKQIGTQTTITPLTYNVILNNKSIISSRIALHKKYSVRYDGNDGFNDYSQTVDFKFFEFESAYQVAVTKDGIEKPSSVFFTLQAGFLFGSQKINDTRYGLTSDEPSSEFFLGPGFTFYQRLGGKAILFAEPSYRFVIKPGYFKVYLGDNDEKLVKLSHLSCHIGIMFLVGKTK